MLYSRRMVYWIYLFILVKVFSHSTFGAGILEVRLMNYANEGYRDEQGFCCGSMNEGSSVCTVPCTPYFRICLKQWQNPVQPEAPCYFGSRLTEVFNDPDPKAANLRLDISRWNGYQESMKFPFSFNWPGTMSLIVEAWHGSSNGSQIITASTTTASNVDVHLSTGKQLLIRIAELRQLKVGFEWTSETHTNNHSRLEVQYRVVCEQHYYGEDCTRFCRPRDDQYGHHVCTANGTKQCMNGWMGSMCNKPICKTGCHSEHGQCEMPGECKCSLGYQGELCDQCVRYPGCVHGTCTRSFECQCDEGWGGLFCNQDLNFCTHHKPCTNGATCTNTGSGHYTCQCRPGYTGVNCENRIETCSENPCLNGGTCSESTSNYTCHCPSGYSGRHCQSNARNCDDSPCENGGSCMDAPGAYRCLCPPGYQGVNCDIERDECAEKNPCLNGGTCITRRASVSSPFSPTPTFYECSCPTGFTGSRCEININDCSMQPCLNGGTCEDLIGSFRCQCSAGFIGMLCQHNIDDCLKRPCANGGTCFDMINDFKCMCRPGFRGKDCSIDINECESNPCRNGGTCTDSIDAYQCRCPPCLAGVNCEQRNDDCMQNLADIWPKPDYFVPYNVSGVPVPSLFHAGSSGNGQHSAGPTVGDPNSSHSVLAIGVPILVVFTLIMIVLIVVVTCLYRKTKRQHSASKQSSVKITNNTDLEACKRQNEWNERKSRQMSAKNNYVIAKTDNRSLENNSEGKNCETSYKEFTKTKRLDPCTSPLHSPRNDKSSDQHQQDKNLNSNYYKIVSVEKLDFSNGRAGQCSSDSGLCTPISCGDQMEDGNETVNTHSLVSQSTSFDSGLAVGSPVSERRDDCQQHHPRPASMATIGDVQPSNFNKSSTVGGHLLQHQQQQKTSKQQQQMHRHHHLHFAGQNHQRHHQNRSCTDPTSTLTGDTMLVMEERTPGAPVCHV